MSGMQCSTPTSGCLLNGQYTLPLKAGGRCYQHALPVLSCLSLIQKPILPPRGIVALTMP